MKQILLALGMLLLAVTPTLAVEQNWKTLGTVDALTDAQIVISDLTYPLAPFVRFMDQDGNSMAEGRIEPGMRVVVGLNDDGKVEAVWHIQELRP